MCWYDDNIYPEDPSKTGILSLVPSLSVNVPEVYYISRLEDSAHKYFSLLLWSGLQVKTP